MNFEHLVMVNDPANPLIAALTREEVWFGLLCRVEDSRPFLPGLEACRVLERSDTEFLRELDFGSVVIRDRVTLQPMEWVRFESERTAEHPGGALTIGIEEPAPGTMVLRFSYATTLADRAADDARYAEFIKSAYHQSDIDTLRVIRMIAESGRLQ